MFGLNREAFLGRTSVSPEWDVTRQHGSPCPGNEHPSMVALATGKPVFGEVVGGWNQRTRSRVRVEVNAIPEFRSEERGPYRGMVTMHDVIEGRLGVQG